MGYTVCNSVRTGEEAIEYCRNFRPNLVIMDVSLDGLMDGIEAGTRIRKEFNIPFVFLTAYDKSEIPDGMRDADPSGCITKPFSDDAIRALLEELL